MGWILDFTINLGKGVGVNRAGGVQSRASVPAETWLFSLQWNLRLHCCHLGLSLPSHEIKAVTFASKGADEDEV